MANHATLKEPLGRKRYIKRYLKQFPWLVVVKRAIYGALSSDPLKLYALCLLAIKAMNFIPITRMSFFRRLAFDTAAPGTVLIAGKNERFVVLASDNIIGRRVYVDNEPYDFDKMQTVLRILGGRPRTLLVDVGANIGTICIPAVKRGLFQRAIAIEPEPRNFALLLANVHINWLADKISPQNFALGATDGDQVVFELSGSNSGDHRVRTTDSPGTYGEAERSTITVRSESFDAVAKDIDPNETVIWLDTQGFEGHILSGAKSALRSRTPIVLEFWPYGLDRSNGYPLLKDALIQNGYSQFYDLEGIIKPLPLTSDSLDGLRRRIGDTGDFTDILVV
ncbi:FkbM family methyltransferase [Bradyrhizobium sp. HKCCYLS2038]|uniref:FkbM family methyltransferase n=1 Tax=unclassified Bradyrhizobium TaxID=2631580 RepID=UPI003EC0A0E1